MTPTGAVKGEERSGNERSKGVAKLKWKGGYTAEVKKRGFEKGDGKEPYQGGGWSTMQPMERKRGRVSGEGMPDIGVSPKAAWRDGRGRCYRLASWKGRGGT